MRPPTLPSAHRSTPLALTLIVTTALFARSADYAPLVHAGLACALLVASACAAWFAGARALVGPDPSRQLLAAAGCLLVTPFVLFSLLIGVGPPHDQPPAQNDLRFLVLAVDSILVGTGLILLREALAQAGERTFSSLGFACAILATPLYVVFCLIQRNDYVAEQLGWSWTASVSGHLRELTPLDALSIPALFFGGALTYLATAALARSARVAGWLGAGGAAFFVGASGLGLGFLVARGMAYPSMQAALAHWTTIPGFIAGIPAVPWMLPCALGVLMLRRCGGGVAAPAPATPAGPTPQAL
jgi:hypothetical protein